MKRIILTEQEIEEISQRIAAEIDSKIENEKRIPVLVGVMKGALNFMASLMKYIKHPIYTDYIRISSYSGTKRSNNVRLLKDISFDCTDRTVIIVEDIIDSGHSMKFLIEHMKLNGAKKVYVCTLIDKAVAREVEVPIDFVGHTMQENKFICGFGLDYYELVRNIPYVFEVDDEDIKKWDALIEKDQN